MSKTFSMSMYANRADLYKAKAEYFESLAEKLKQEAVIHAQESKTHKSIVLEIYRGLGIQKGSWNGSKVVLDKFKQMEKDLSDWNDEFLV